ncbi:protein saal1 [Lingula anatina]|uniref:Protein saal1 n=1 Tax=Lingula anatina TaxID=7574 RepID=A0A1S3KGF5_LINAN|nr:protein saal1 [Lingula anatina]|eukprot:XP_013421718.1 protein saal1 [Lingula anatina]
MGETWNPSPPRELTEENAEIFTADNIGNTVYSKHWLFTTLMKLIQEVDKHEENKDQEQETELGTDVDENLQDELCKLWDMSMDMEVVKFLMEFKAIEILTGAIAKSKAPRITEICVGILGNMVCDPNASKTMSENSKLIELSLLLLESPDSPTLVETTRFLHTCLSSSCPEPWITAIKESEQVMESVTFIFKSSTNNDLLKNAACFVDKLLDMKENICEQWATENFVLALLEAIKQIGAKPSEMLENFFHIFQLLTTTQEGVPVIVSQSDFIVEPIMKFLVHLCEDEIISITGHENSIASAISVLNTVLTSSEGTIALLTEDKQLMRCLLKVLEAACCKLNKNAPPRHKSTDQRSASISDSKSLEIMQNKQKQPNTTDSEKTGDEGTQSDSAESNATSKETKVTFSKPQEAEAGGDAVFGEGGRNGTEEIKSSSQNDLNRSDSYDEEATKLLYSVLQGFCRDVVLALHQLEDPDDEDEENTEPEELITPKCLEYMETSCSRDRIKHLLKTLRKEKKTQSNVSEDDGDEDINHLQLFQDVAERYDMERLKRIYHDALRT